MSSRRDFLKQTGALGAVTIIGNTVMSSETGQTGNTDAGITQEEKRSVIPSHCMTN